MLERPSDPLCAVSLVKPEWFYYLRDRKSNRVNYWTPTPWNIRKLKKGDRFYFLLKSPYRVIGGYAYFSHYENLSAIAAWDKYGQDNGFETAKDMISACLQYAEKLSKHFIPSDDPTIGCIVLEDPVFFEDTAFIAPADVGLVFDTHIVKFKYFRAFELRRAPL